MGNGTQRDEPRDLAARFLKTVTAGGLMLSLTGLPRARDAAAAAAVTRRSR